MSFISRSTSILILSVLIGFSILFVSFESHSQQRKRVDIEYENSEVSIEGDDRFITRRYTWEPLRPNYIWEETLRFSKGIISYGELVPGYFFTGQNQ